MSEQQPQNLAPEKANPSPAPPPQASTSGVNKRQSIINKAFSKDNRKTAKQFFSAYAQTWVGLSPIWLMGEAIIPGAKVGTTFKEGKSKLFMAAEDVSKAVSTTGSDIVVILDSKLNDSKAESGKAAEVIKAAGDNAMVVVTSSLDKIQAYLNQSKSGPEIKKVVTKNGRDVIVIIDKALKHPIVITGVAKFARSKGIPHAEAILRLASLGLARILKAMPEENLPGVETIVEEVDAAELERKSSREETDNAAQVGKYGEGKPPQVQTASSSVSTKKKDGQCTIM